MKVLQLSGEQIGALLSQPESGMGFQVVEISRPYAREEEVWIAFNAELALAFDDKLEMRRWSEHRSAIPVEWLRDQAVEPGRLYQQPRVVVSRAGVGLQAVTYGPSSRVAPAPLSLVKQSVTIAGAQYRRFSAFRYDKRVNPHTGDFSPGTYATTVVDEPLSPSGFAAVGRYALPNVSAASFVHSLTTGVGVVVHSGTVAPAYGQSGGGVEVFFPNGAKNTSPLDPPRLLTDE
jgi:hypothetical protein